MLQASSTRETREAAREVKFLVTPSVAAAVLEWARPRLAPDPYANGEAGDEYHTTSLYFDTDALAVYHRRGSFKRSKYRIRRYGTADVVFLERKLRTSHMLTKRRTTVPIDDLTCLAEHRLDPAWAGYWFSQRIEARRLSPVCQVAYHRHARVGIGPYGPLRLTFDDQIVAQPAVGFSFQPHGGIAVLQTHSIIEMKYRVDMPAVLRQLVEKFALEPASVSKYRLSIEALRRADAEVGARKLRLQEIIEHPAPVSSAINA
jgi:hypothetical protein